MIRYPITPVPAPRQVHSDRWNLRPSVMRYRLFRDECRLHRIKIPATPYLAFYLPMPRSWSEKRKARYRGTPHMSRPDWDNLAKGLIDACCKEDGYIHAALVTKTWADEGSIVVGEFDPRTVMIMVAGAEHDHAA